MGNRRTFDDWLQELREITKEVLSLNLEDLPEFDRADARSYYRDRSSPSLYFKECLAEHVGDDAQKLAEILPRVE